ncbi:tagatose-bisphosphate aldolase subunit GatZ [Alginatibacterium sediminis]|uniref:D-tagatose-1,6-bisphosphate aldolase subunit GatZ n=1 Tax=Alginatibacterium sediminis TaxID=2164068 RepID=A0A420EHD3_9ALTE|nr:tagatose-bisphosphate aldolase subunit GatZ [Alginatibacterium sediminis]RKF20078.1 tagatose-bisphosphate aldolase subunit GatZ [Alginatibacterium sediminis]
MKSIIAKHKSGKPIGIYSVCSAHPLVIEATLRHELHTKNKVLIEATSNQCNQFGGYTGMLPADYRQFIETIATDVGFPIERIILGGDHLGPNCWQDESAESAMLKSEDLIKAYVQAGFTKIHLDASMSCADDPIPLDPEVVAQRAARLCVVAEECASDEQRKALSYVIGTEVPIPGGEKEAITSVHVTRVEDAKNTIDTHVEAFKRSGIEHAISKVVGIVVQPGVEFDHSSVIRYDREAAKDLSKYIESTDFVYEAHSTDYQTAEAFKQLVEDHYAILKVGPAVTFALREAIFSLAEIESQLVSLEQQSHISQIIDEVMLDEPKYWKRYYAPEHSKAMIDLHYSLSDRIRYYWPDPRISAALDKLLHNLNKVEIPLGMLSQYFPVQYQLVAQQKLKVTAKALILNKIQQVLLEYSFGCGKHDA